MAFKLGELAALAPGQPILDLERDVRALVEKHGLRRSAIGRMLAAARGEKVTAAANDDMEDDAHDDQDWTIQHPAVKLPIAATKLMCGLYGGLFSFHEEGNPFGGGSTSTLTCLVDHAKSVYSPED